MLEDRISCGFPAPVGGVDLSDLVSLWFKRRTMRDALALPCVALPAAGEGTVPTIELAQALTGEGAGARVIQTISDDPPGKLLPETW